MKKVTTKGLIKMKSEGKKISALTAYDYQTAQLLDEAGIDLLLVGDSLGMVVLGYENTLAVTVDDMVHHTKAVVRGTERAMVIADMPFMSYQTGTRDTLINAGRLMKETGAHGVKLEGGKEVLEQVEALVQAGIPVFGHLGLTPQSVHQMGGFKVQGKDDDQAKQLIADAKALEEAGVFAIVLECIPGPLAKEVSEILTVPTIGIGAGPDCDGQILVTQDLLGMDDSFKPKFVRRYARLDQRIKEAITEYIDDVREEQFPAVKESFGMKDADKKTQLYSKGEGKSENS